jgi:hypothetical protein
MNAQQAATRTSVQQSVARALEAHPLREFESPRLQTAVPVFVLEKLVFLRAQRPPLHVGPCRFRHHVRTEASGEGLAARMKPR